MIDVKREGTTFGRYVLLDKIGVGGMAEILRAKTFGAAGFEKEFAIKLILPSLVDDQEFVEMFINEAKIAVSLYHANIVQVFDLGQIDEQYYIAMEYVHGKDLLDVLARCADLEIKVPFQILLYIGMEMLKGLDFAHRAKNPYGEDLNIVHRDVSPSNILISYGGDVKVGDFGVAKAAVRRTLTESGTLKGKVGYMSPEQVVGESIDARSDIFSAGIVFFEALSMKRLFTGSSDLNIMLRIRDMEISEHMDRAGDLPEALQEIVRRSLARQREERFQSAGEFYEALVEFCFQYKINTTANDLSNFMRRLFSQEIEEEKTRRLSDPHGPSEASWAVQMSGGNSSASTSAVLQSRKIKTGRVSQQNSTAPKKPRYRYKTSDGAVYGPMTITSLRGFITNRSLQNEDRVSKENSVFLHPAAFSEIQDLARSEESKLVMMPNELSASKEPAPQDDTQERASTLAAQSENIEQEFDNDAQRVLSGVVEEIKQNYTSYKGTFAQMSFPRLMARLNRIKSTGRLLVKRGDVEKSVFFQNGQIILVESNLDEERLGSFLINRNVITEVQMKEGLNRLSEWGGRLGDALVAIGAVPAHEIFLHLSEQMRQKILEVFSWDDGTFGYYENQEPSMHGYPLDVNCIETVIFGCRECVPMSRIVDHYTKGFTMPLTKRESFPLNTLRLRGMELRVAHSIEENTSIQDVLESFASQQELVYKTIYLLHQVEWLSFEATVDDFEFPDGPSRSLS